MRTVHFIGGKGCTLCESLIDSVVKPARERHPEHVFMHFDWDAYIAEANGRCSIARIPLFVVENEGSEEFRFSGAPSLEELESIIACEGETLSFDDVAEVHA